MDGLETQNVDPTPFLTPSVYPGQAGAEDYARSAQRAMEKYQSDQYLQGFRNKRVVARGALGDVQRVGDQFAAHVAGSSPVDKVLWGVVIVSLCAAGGAFFEAKFGKGRAA